MTSAPFGGVNSNSEAGGTAKSTSLKPISATGFGRSPANTWTRRATCSVPSMAIRTLLISERSSLGRSTSSYAGRPATVVSVATGTSVLSALAARIF